MSEISLQNEYFTPKEIAEILCKPIPSPEQQVIISTPPEGGALVIAGAGSGKTETLANRVVWLVANGFVLPEQVLGLTFTVKAAGELTKRVRNQLLDFAKAAGKSQKLTDRQRSRIEELKQLLQDGINTPEISTYDAFAAGCISEFGAYLGFDAGRDIVGEELLLQLALETIHNSKLDRVMESPDSFATLAENLISLDQELTGNLVSLETFSKAQDEFNKWFLVEKITGFENQQKYAAQKAGIMIPLIAQYRKLKEQRGYQSFADRTAEAVLLSKEESVKRTLRNRFKVILLDEVQDTSSVQVALLSGFFAGMHVMGVGDPHQSIYGWRGADAGVLETFFEKFAPGQDSRVLSLSVSWRNPGAVLCVANVIAEPLRVILQDRSPDIKVKKLRSKESLKKDTVEETSDDKENLNRPSDCKEKDQEILDSEDNDPVVHLYAHADEWQGIERTADWVAARMQNEYATETPTGAVLVRTKSQMPALEKALRARNLQVQVIGSGGLLFTPEIVDIVGVLRILATNAAGKDLLRLLSGPRFNIGLRDLRALVDSARHLAKQDANTADTDSEEWSPERGLGITNAEALDLLLEAGDSSLVGFSAVGLMRLKEAALMLRRLRRQAANADILSLVKQIEKELFLDIELYTVSKYLDRATGRKQQNPRAALDQFITLVRGFLRTEQRAGLTELVNWLELVAKTDKQGIEQPEPVPGTVQILTVHAAKGLEWDYVAVPSLVQGKFPLSLRDGNGELRSGAIFERLRADWKARKKYITPLKNIDPADFDPKEVKKHVDVYKKKIKEASLEEERRLAYVAVTRAKKELLLSGYGEKLSPFWEETKTAIEKARQKGKNHLPAEIVVEMDSSASEGAFTETISWPKSPLGTRTNEVTIAAETVLNRLKSDSFSGTDPAIRLLLAEKDEQCSMEKPELSRLSTSALHAFKRDPAKFARDALRPVPVRRSQNNVLGTVFHEWVEKYFQLLKSGELLNLETHVSNPVVEGGTPRLRSDLRNLINGFMKSRFADRSNPARYVEIPITMQCAGKTIECVIDAIYENPDGSWEIVDWKTSFALPETDADKRERLLQLEMYMHAFARWKGIGIEKIEGSLCYIRHGEKGIIRIERGEVRDLAEIEREISEAEESANAQV